MDFSAARKNMVESQLRTNRVVNPELLDAFLSVPREYFLPAAVQHRAYVDEHVAFGDRRFLMPAMPLGRMIQALAPKMTDNALVAGAGIGYVPTLLGRLCQCVFAVENSEDLVDSMTSTLTDMAADNVVATIADIKDGYSDQGPYDIILFAGSVDVVPEAFLNQLGEGGRLIAPVNGEDGICRITLYVKRGGVVSNRVVFECNVKPLPEFQAGASFVF